MPGNRPSDGYYLNQSFLVTGPDGIGNRLLRECADSLAIPLTDIYNKSMNDMVFPTEWKLSHISPVYKKSLRHDKVNYRPVSLLACMSKPMERIVYNVMYNFFKSLGLLNARNSGFKEKDSTINQLIHLCNNIYKGLDETKDVWFSWTFLKHLTRCITLPYYINCNAWELVAIF